jgi:hypothetical protein
MFRVGDASRRHEEGYAMILRGKQMTSSARS